MKKFLVSTVTFFSGVVIGYFGNYLNEYKKPITVKFDFDNYKAKTDYEIWNEIFDDGKDDCWNLEKKIKVDSVDLYQLTITGVNDKGQTEKFLIKSKEFPSIFSFLDKKLTKK